MYDSLFCGTKEYILRTQKIRKEANVVWLTALFKISYFVFFYLQKNVWNDVRVNK